MDKTELINLIEERIDEIAYAYQEANNIQSGDISPLDAFRLTELAEELAEIIMRVGRN